MIKESRHNDCARPTYPTPPTPLPTPTTPSAPSTARTSVCPCLRRSATRCPPINPPAPQTSIFPESIREPVEPRSYSLRRFIQARSWREDLHTATMVKAALPLPARDERGEGRGEGL